MMKTYIFLIILLFIVSASFGQYKIVKISSEDIYINYFYKQKQIKRNKNDTIYFLCKTISPSIFLLEKYISNKKIYTKKYKTVIAKDSLIVNEKIHDSLGIPKIIRKKALYFEAVQIGK